MTERAFVRNLDKAGFSSVAVLERRSLNIDDRALYPLFTDELLALMRNLISREKQARIAIAIVA